MFKRLFIPKFHDYHDHNSIHPASHLHVIWPFSYNSCYVCKEPAPPLLGPRLLGTGANTMVGLVQGDVLGHIWSLHKCSTWRVLCVELCAPKLRCWIPNLQYCTTVLPYLETVTEKSQLRRGHTGAVCACVLSCVPTLCDPMDGSPSGSSVHWISQPRTLKWVAISSPRESSQPRWMPHPTWEAY